MKRSIIPNKLRPGKKPQEQFSATKKIEKIQGQKFVWIDMQNPDRRDVEELSKNYNFNPLNIEDCMTKSELPKLDSYDDHVFIILHFPPLATKPVMPKFSQLSIFMGKDFLVTIHQGDLKPLIELVTICKEEIDPQKKAR